MTDGKWEDWTEPLEILLATAKEFLDTVKAISYRIRKLPDGGRLVVAPELYTRKEELAKALALFIKHMNARAKNENEAKIPTWETDFLTNYIYVSDVYEDVIHFVFEYIGENEHQANLHGDEFAQTAETLLEDFALYVKSWTSPYWRNLE